MSLNYPGPFELRIKYVTSEPVQINNHQLRLSFNVPGGVVPGAAFNTIFPVQRDGGTLVNLANHLNAIIAVIDDHLQNTTDFTEAELWEYAPGTFDAVFRTAQAIGTAGASSTGTVQMSQTIWSFRTVMGGVFKIDLRGTIYAAGAKQSFPNVGAIQALANYFTGASNIVIGRDNSFPLSPLGFFPGQNEQAFKELNR